MSSHTPGRARYDGFGIYVFSAQDGAMLGDVPIAGDAERHLLRARGVGHGRSDEELSANARRFAAGWNAIEGLATEDVEQHNLDCKSGQGALTGALERLDTNRCNSGHVTLPLTLWDCPECHNETRRQRDEALRRVEELERRARLSIGTLPCGGCGGPHSYDTSVPSAVWNAVIRERGLSEYLCLKCVVREFARAAERSFTAELYGDGLSGLPIEVRFGGKVALDAGVVSNENTALRVRLSEIEPALAVLRDVKAWRDSEGNEPFPHEVRAALEAVLGPRGPEPVVVKIDPADIARVYEPGTCAHPEECPCSTGEDEGR